MNELLNLLKDGHARTTLMLASELHTTPADIRRKLEFLENAGIIKRISFTASSCGGGSCSSCTGCSPNAENDPDGRKGKSGCSGSNEICDKYRLPLYDQTIIGQSSFLPALLSP